MNQQFLSAKWCKVSRHPDERPDSEIYAKSVKVPVSDEVAVPYLMVRFLNDNEPCTAGVTPPVIMVYLINLFCKIDFYPDCVIRSQKLFFELPVWYHLKSFEDYIFCPFLLSASYFAYIITRATFSI